MVAQQRVGALMLVVELEGVAMLDHLDSNYTMLSYHQTAVANVKLVD